MEIPGTKHGHGRELPSNDGFRRYGTPKKLHHPMLKPYFWMSIIVMVPQ
jgi:hypothetical protein